MSKVLSGLVYKKALESEGSNDWLFKRIWCYNHWLWIYIT
jgi:hypothetical protein